MMNDHVLSRRSVLRAIVAAGCSLCMPIALFADEAKKDAGASSAPEVGKKVPQASVKYQSKPKGEQKCSTCTNFIAKSNTCKLVEGKISPEGWCNLWIKKT